MQSNFSHIYLEKEALHYPDAKLVLEKFPKATLVQIDNYMEFFARARQDFRAQKSSKKIILAKKRSGFLYPGSKATPDFGHKNFFYNSLVLNCLFDCQYCYLQGMYPSANIVSFVNSEDFFDATSQKLSELGELYLCISYDTDLLAFEGIIPHAKRWIEFARGNPGLTLELRTKSANYRAISSILPTQNFILAWTFSPESVVHQIEKDTPSLKARLKSAQAALSAGWQVRICIDPVIIVEGWEDAYKDLINQIFEVLDPNKFRDFYFGSLRMNREYFKAIKKQYSAAQIFEADFSESHKTVTYSPQIQNLIKNKIISHALRFMPEEKLFMV